MQCIHVAQGSVLSLRFWREQVSYAPHNSTQAQTRAYTLNMGKGGGPMTALPNIILACMESWHMITNMQTVTSARCLLSRDFQYVGVGLCQVDARIINGFLTTHCIQICVYVGCNPGITRTCIIVRPWLFLLLQAYTFTNLLSWHTHHDWGDLSLFVQVSSEGQDTN